MPEIELKQSEVRERYDVPAVQKRYVAIPAALLTLAAYFNGFDRLETWALAGFGIGVGFSMIAVFPRFFLRRR